MNPEADFEKELNGIRDAYRGFRAKKLHQSLWAPFGSSEAAWRARQAEVFITVLRERGWSSLAGRKVLDFGCGRGRHLRQFLDWDAAPDLLDGIDLDAPAVEEAKMLSPNIRVQLATGITLPYPDGAFDLITQFVVFSSIPSEALRLRIAAELDRVLRPGGFFFWWDMDHMAALAGGHDLPLTPAIHFPHYGGTVLNIGERPPPSESLRHVRFLGPLMGFLADRFACHPSHHAALFEKPFLPPHASS